MRLSADRSSPDHSALVRFYAVYLDGVLQRNVLEADDADEMGCGHVTVCLTDDAGRFVHDASGARAATETRHGTVAFRLWGDDAPPAIEDGPPPSVRRWRETYYPAPLYQPARRA